MAEKTKMLSQDEQLKLKALVDRGDHGAEESLLMSCRPMIVRMAYNYCKIHKHIDMEDLIQEGLMAGLRAIRDWNPDIACLTTVVYTYARTEMRKYIRFAYRSAKLDKRPSHSTITYTRNEAEEQLQYEDMVKVLREKGFSDEYVRYLETAALHMDCPKKTRVIDVAKMLGTTFKRVRSLRTMCTVKVKKLGLTPEDF